MQLTTAASALRDRVHARLDARLQTDVAHPVALALSGGGDSLALLHFAADWARGRGRRLLAVTIDHGLNPDSPAWSALCARAARDAGADWIERRWEGDKPATGLPAAARAARHALIAEAARDHDARVVLFAHTADDIAEADWMRERGSTLGNLREWSPSPAWPEGRGLMLLRPLLGEERGGLRDWLRAKGRNWIEDPGNTKFVRGQARKALLPLPVGEGLRLAERSDARSQKGGGRVSPVSVRPSPFRASPIADAFGRSSPLPLGEGFEIDRSLTHAALAAVLLCAAGRTTPPRGDRLDRVVARLRSGDAFTATLAGARIVADPDRILIIREAGEFTRARRPDIRLSPDRPVVWDGRYELIAREPGWTVVPAAGRLSRLSPADRTLLTAVTAPARPTLPVLIRDDRAGPVLAWRQAEVRALAPRRLGLALGETTQEADLDRPIHGETPPSDLFSPRQDHHGRRHAGP